MVHWGEYHYDAAVPKRSKNKKKRERVELLDPERIALHRQDLKADGPKAKVMPAEVPNKRARKHNPPPDRTFRSAGQSLLADRDFWLGRAFDEEGVPLRSAEISDSVAKSYWDRFLGLVRFTDLAAGVEETKDENIYDDVWSYLQTKHVSPWIMYFAENPKPNGIFDHMMSIL